MAVIKYYGVKEGNRIGVFGTWEETQGYVSGYAGAIYKSFKKYDDAFYFVYGYYPEEDNQKNKTPLKQTPMVKLKKPLYDLNYVDVYVDGSYNELNDTIGYGIVFFLPDGTIIKDCGRIPTKDTSTRNVFGELYSMIRTIQMAIANEFKDIIVHYDYEGIEKWTTGEWKAKTPITKHYVNYFNQYVTVEKRVNVVFNKVSAHSGIVGNEMADKLAKMGCCL